MKPPVMAYAMTATEGELAEGQERLAWAISKGAGIPQSALRAASPLSKGANASLVKGGGICGANDGGILLLWKKMAERLRGNPPDCGENLPLWLHFCHVCGKIAENRVVWPFGKQESYQ